MTGRVGVARATRDNFIGHAGRRTSDYDEVWRTSPEYPARVTELIAEALELKQGHRLADVGCGRGTYAVRLRRLVGLQEPVVCVDPHEPDLVALPSQGLRALRATAQEFAAQAHVYDRLLLKEVVHHIAPLDTFFDGVAVHLAPRGRFVVVMWPPTLEHYPLFDAARDLFRRKQPHYEDVARAAVASGFLVEVEQHAVSVSFARERWLAMVGRRYMSLLASFSDEDLAAGIAEIRERYADQPTIAFDDDLVFVVGSLNG